MENTKIHFIDDCLDGRVLAKVMAWHVPSVGDEIRLGGVRAERYFRVVRRVFVYDEETIAEIDRVNVGVVEVL